MAMSVSRRPFRARRGPGGHLGFRRSGSTLGYDPTAASRLPSPDERGSVRFSQQAHALGDNMRISTTLILACALVHGARPGGGAEHHRRHRGARH